MIYVASPYSDKSAWKRYCRYRQARDWLAKYVKDNKPTIAIYSPIVHWHPAATAHRLSKSAGFWENQNRDMLRLSSKVFLLCMPGWQSSLGVSMELEWAKQHGIPVEPWNDSSWK